MAEQLTDFEIRLLEGPASFVNFYFTSVESLPKAPLLLQHLLQHQKAIEHEKETVAQEKARAVEQARGELESALRTLSGLRDQCQSLGSSCRDQSDTSGELATEVAELCARLGELQREKDFFRTAQKIKQASAQGLEAAQTSTPSALPFYEELRAITAQLTARAAEAPPSNLTPAKAAAGQQQTAPAGSIGSPASFASLLQMAVAKTDKLRQVLIDDFTRDMKQALQALHWPAPRHTVTVTDESLAQFRSVFAHLLALHSTDDVPPSANSPEASDQVASNHGLVAMDLLLEPLVSRFQYHFEGNKQTNRLDKPEWYMTHVLNSIREHGPFFEGEVQVLLNDAGLARYDAKTEFARGLVACVCGKLRADTEELIERPVLLAHTIDEVVTFEQALRSELSDPEGMPSVIGTMCENEEILKRWLFVERENASVDIEAVIDRDDAWDPKQDFLDDLDEMDFDVQHGRRSKPRTDHDNEGVTAEADDLPPTASVESLVSALTAITERYRLIPDRVVRVRFLHEVQMPLLETFEKEAKKALYVERKLATATQWRRLCACLNSVEYLENTLTDWGDQLFFLDLRDRLGAKSGESPASERDDDDQEGSTVFSAFIDKLRTIREDEVRHVVTDVIVSKFKDGTRKYFKQSKVWKDAVGGGSAATGRYLELSSELCEPFAALEERLLTVHTNLRPGLFKPLCRQVMKDICSHVYDALSSGKMRLSVEGAQQVQFDMTAMFLLFRPYSAKPENLFKEVKDACLLAALPADQIESLKSELRNSTASPAEAERCWRLLIGRNVFKLSPAEALTICDLRIPETGLAG